MSTCTSLTVRVAVKIRSVEVYPRVPRLRFFFGRARHFSQTGSNRPLSTRAENGASARGQRPFARDWLGTTACRSRQSLVSTLPSPGLSQRWMRATSGRGWRSAPVMQGSPPPSDPRAPNAQGTESPVLTMRPRFWCQE